MTETVSADSDAQASSISGEWHKAWRFLEPAIRPGLMLLVFFASLWLLHHEFKSMRYEDVVASFRAISGKSIAAAIAFTAANFVVMIGYDWLGVRLVEHRVSSKQVVLASLLSYAFSNTLGVFLGGAPVRARLYSSFGMPPSDIVRLVLVIGVAFWLGMFSLAGFLFVVAPFDIPERFHLPLASSRPLGILLLVVAAVFLLICGVRQRRRSKCEHSPPQRRHTPTVACSKVPFLCETLAHPKEPPRDAPDRHNVIMACHTCC